MESISSFDKEQPCKLFDFNEQSEKDTSHGYNIIHCLKSLLYFPDNSRVRVLKVKNKLFELEFKLKPAMTFNRIRSIQLVGKHVVRVNIDIDLLYYYVK